MEAILSKEGGRYDLYRIDEDGKRVTFASTQDYKQKLSLKNCQAIERGYDLDAIIENNTNEYITTNIRKFNYGFEKGFQKALEILGDKKFSEEDLREAISQTRKGMLYNKKYEDEYIKSLQQTEWEVEIEMVCPHPVDTYRCGIQYGCDEDGCNHPNQVPYLDADGCLILKRI